MFKVEVKYNSHLDNVEIGDLSCENFEGVFDFSDYVLFVKKHIAFQLKYDALYRDVNEARMTVFINNEHVATVNYRRAVTDSNEIVITGWRKRS